MVICFHPFEIQIFIHLLATKITLSKLYLFRFKVEVRVVDDSGSATFVLFDRDVRYGIHKSASELRECSENVS